MAGTFSSISYSGGKKKLKMDEVNTLSHSDFVRIFGNVVEHNILAASSVYTTRPFKNFDEIRNKFERFIKELNHNGRLGVLLLYPDLASKLIHTGQLTTESRREQAIGGFDSLSRKENKKMTKLEWTLQKKVWISFHTMYTRK
ncbi:hypothetical protein ACF0H5_019960 [Mactra antiquata]